MNWCHNCGSWYFGSGHACHPRYQWTPMPSYPVYMPAPVTAEEIRKIVREELAAAGIKPRQMHAVGCGCMSCLDGITRSNMQQS